jgi:hypothetical protein
LSCYNAFYEVKKTSINRREARKDRAMENIAAAKKELEAAKKHLDAAQKKFWDCGLDTPEQKFFKVLQQRALRRFNFAKNLLAMAENKLRFSAV